MFVREWINKELIGVIVNKEELLAGILMVEKELAVGKGIIINYKQALKIMNSMHCYQLTGLKITTERTLTKLIYQREWL